MYIYVWEYRVRADKTETFLRHYAPQGTWAQLFRASPGYLGTELLKDRDDPARFVTADRWTSDSEHAAFLEANRVAYLALDAECEALTQSETLIGHFNTDSSPSQISST